MKIGKTIIVFSLAITLALVNVLPTLAASPFVTNVTSSSANTSYNAAKSISIQVTFDQAVIVDTSGGIPMLALNSSPTAAANYSSGSGTTTLTFIYIVSPGDNSADLDYAGTDSLATNGGTIQNAGFENADLTLPPPSAVHSLGFNKDIVIDTTPPTVTDVTSGTSDGSYKIGQSIDIEVTFSEIVVKTGTPTLGLNSGGTASYSSGTQTNVLTFTYTVAAGNTSPDLDYTNTSSLTGTIKDGAGNSATLTLPATGGPNSLGGHKNIIIDTTAPTINTGAPSASFTKSGPVSYTVTYADTNFSASTLSTSDITLNTTGTATGTIGVSGSGTTRTVTVSSISGDGTLGISIAAGTASDTAGNLAPASGNSTTFTVDNTPPTITIGAPSASITRSGPVTYAVTYADANFNTSSLTTGNITLNKTSTANGTIGLTGSGTSYTVTISGISGDGTLGISIAAGTASDKAGNTAPAPGASTTFIVDNTPPSVTINQAAGQSDPTNSSPVNFTAVFSESVTDFVGSDVTLSGTANPTTATVTGGPTTFNVAVSGMTSSGTVMVDIAASKAHDAAGNANTASTSTDRSVTYDATTLTVTINQASAQLDPTNASPINFTVVFNKAVSDFTDVDVSLSGTAGASSATVTGSGTTYNVAVSGMSGNGTIIASIPATVAHDAFGNANTASTATDNTVTYDATPPTVTINKAASQSDPTNTSPINFTVTFSETVTDFATGDVSLSGTANATTATVSGGPTTYNVAVSGMTTSGTVIANIAQNVAHDTAGNGNNAATFSDNSVTFDSTALTVTINEANAQSDPTNTSPINFTVIFSKSITGFVNSDVSLSGTAGATTASVTGSGTTYNVAVSGMIGNGTVIANIPASVAQDAAGNLNVPSTSTDNTVTYDTVIPTVTINQAAAQADPTKNSPINFTVVFSKTIVDFATGDVSLGGTAGATTATVTGGPTTYNVAVSGMARNGTITASITPGMAHDAAGNANAASTSSDNSVTYDTIAPNFSAVTPVTGAHINSISASSAVSYTLSENIASGSISMVWSSGVSDPGAPHICALKGTALTSGTHNNLDLSDTINSCSQAQSLISGAVYTFSFNATDAAGNVAATVTSTNVTFETTGPVFSAVTPASDSSINNITTNSDVSYSLSKPIVSGSITMTWTGGTSDVSHTCTLKGNALNSGVHNHLNLSNTTNSCTTAQSLVDGAIYTFTFRGTDSAGNQATPVISTNVTFDTTAPIFFSVSPASNSYISSVTLNSAISYTLSEVVASGSITMTQTGGTADPGSPHTCNLTGTALVDGAHNNLDLSDTTNACTEAQSLVDGSVYTFVFNATDAASNTANPVTRTVVTFENTAPVFSTVTPGTNAFIRAITNDTTKNILSGVGYTLSKNIASGSITMTKTGGSIDTGSPHICTLKGAALTGGVHANLDLTDTANSCTVAQSLVDGAIYSFTFRGTDAAGNVAPTVTSTDVTFDKTSPTISWSIPTPCGSSPCIYNVADLSYQLAVNSSDNVGISMVVFKRYDYVNHSRVEIGRAYDPPYSINFDTSQLLPSDNEIDAIAIDAANNSTWIYLFLHHLPVVTVNKTGSGKGTVTSSPPGIDCGLTCSAGYSESTVVTLTAIPTSPSTFGGWSGVVCSPGDPGCSCSGTGTCKVTMDQAKSVIATFNNHWRIYLPLIKH